MKITKLSDKSMEITETETRTYQTSIDDLERQKIRYEEELVKINTRITEANKLGILKD